MSSFAFDVGNRSLDGSVINAPVAVADDPIVKKALLYLNTESLRLQLVSALGLSQMGITAISLTPESEQPIIGHNRAVAKLSVEAKNGDETVYRGSLALKLTSDLTEDAVSFRECFAEVEIGNALKNGALFARHGSASYVAALFSDYPDTIKSSLLASLSKVTANAVYPDVMAQLNQWVEGKTLREMFQIAAVSNTEDDMTKLSAAIKNSMSVMIKMWRDLSNEGRPLVFNTAMSDIVITPDGTPVFIDLCGGRKCGGAFNLMRALQDFSKGVRLSSQHLMGSDIPFLVSGPAIGAFLSGELGRDAAAQVVYEAKSNSSNFPPDFRHLFLPEISRIVGA